MQNISKLYIIIKYIVLAANGLGMGKYVKRKNSFSDGTKTEIFKCYIELH